MAEFNAMDTAAFKLSLIHIYPRDVVLCACSNKQLYEIEHAMQALDPGCFIIMLQSNEVHGEGFRQLELGKNENRNE